MGNWWTEPREERGELRGKVKGPIPPLRPSLKGAQVCNEDCLREYAPTPSPPSRWNSLTAATRPADTATFLPTPPPRLGQVRAAGERGRPAGPAGSPAATRPPPTPAPSPEEKAPPPPASLSSSASLRLLKPEAGPTWVFLFFPRQCRPGALPRLKCCWWRAEEWVSGTYVYWCSFTTEKVIPLLWANWQYQVAFITGW